LTVKPQIAAEPVVHFLPLGPYSESPNLSSPTLHLPLQKGALPLIIIFVVRQHLAFVPVVHFLPSPFLSRSTRVKPGLHLPLHIGAFPSQTQVSLAITKQKYPEIKNIDVVNIVEKNHFGKFFILLLLFK
jgi:hypothetical protein